MADTKISAMADVVTLAKDDKFAIADVSALTTDTYATAREIKEYVQGYTTQATAGGTTTLTVDSMYYQFFTGTLAQDCVLPDATTLQLGDAFYIDNNSTGIVTIKTNGGAVLIAVPANNDTMVKVTDIGTAAGVWDTNSYADRTAQNTWLATQTLMVGDATNAPMNFQPGTLKTTPADGDIEMDANCLYFTHDAGNRGVVVNSQLIRQNADRAAFTNNTSQQAIFNSVAGGTITLETGTYLFEGLIQVKATSATSGNVKLSILGAGTATLAGILWQSYGMDAAVDTLTAISGITEIVATQVVANLSTASTATVTTFMVKGTFQVTAAGTLIPSVAQTTGAATMVTTAGSYFMLNRIGSTTVTNVGQWT